MIKPTATVTVEPMERRSRRPAEHSIKVNLKLSPGDPTFSDKGHVVAIARKALAGFGPAPGDSDRRRFGDVSVTTKTGKTGAVHTVVVGIEGTAVIPDRPPVDAVTTLRDVLQHEGYRVALVERRECVEAGCKTEAVVEWDHAEQIPPGWHSSTVCGAHNYRSCARCKSLFRLTSTNYVGQAPSVHCEVCGQVIIEWGSSKAWTAELITRSGWTAPAAPS